MRDISNVKQEIINFRKIIRPQRAVLRDLERVKMRFIADDLEIYFDDIVDASERMWDMLENYKEVVEALEATNESVISHNVNDVLRVLTLFSVFFLPLTLISGIFGMNNLVPGEGSTDGFWIVIGVMVVTVGGMLALLPQTRLALARQREDPNRAEEHQQQRAARRVDAQGDPEVAAQHGQVRVLIGRLCFGPSRIERHVGPPGGGDARQGQLGT